MQFLQTFIVDHFDARQTCERGQACYPFELIQTFLGMRKPDRTCLVVTDRLTRLLRELLIELDAVFLKLHDVQAGAERRKVARGVPGGSRR
ncbi:hypothetical protein D3C87_1836810 [compost metagenome]